MLEYKKLFEPTVRIPQSEKHFFGISSTAYKATDIINYWMCCKIDGNPAYEDERASGFFLHTLAIQMVLWRLRL